MKQGTLNILKSAKMLLDSNSISKDVVLVFDEMNLQKREEYAGGKLVGADTDGNLYKGSYHVFHDCRITRKCTLRSESYTWNRSNRRMD